MKLPTLQTIADTLGWDYQTTKRAKKRGWPLHDPVALWQKVNAAPGKKPPLDILRAIVDSVAPAAPGSKVKSSGSRITAFTDSVPGEFRSGIEFELARLERECDCSHVEWARELAGGTKTTRRKIDQANVDLFRVIASMEPETREVEQGHLTSILAHETVALLRQKLSTATTRLVKAINRALPGTGEKVTQETEVALARFNDSTHSLFRPVPLTAYWTMVLRTRRRANQFYCEYVDEADLGIRATRHTVWVGEMNRYAKFLKDAKSTELTAHSLVSRSTFDSQIDRAMTEWRNDLSLLPRRLAMDSVTNTHDPVDVDHAVEAEVNDTLAELNGVPHEDRLLARSRPDPRATPESLDPVAWPHYTKTFLRLKAAANGRGPISAGEQHQLLAAKAKDREHRRVTWGY